MSTGSKETQKTDAIEATASDWLIRRDSASWSEDDQRQLDAWLKASPFHRVAYLRLEASWEDSERLKALGAGIAGDAPPPRGQWNLGPHFERPWEGREDTVAQPIRARKRTRVPLALAATILLALLIGAYLMLLRGGDHYSTAVGRIESVSLPDGSRVTLNTDSEIQVHLSATERDIDLKHGEAFFHVAKDATRPFVVSAGGKRVVAVGTQFSVRRELTDVEVVVTEGQVRVEEGGVSPIAPGTGVPEEVLAAGSIARAGSAGVLVQRGSVEQAQARLAWRSGLLMFRDQTLASAVKEFNRYNAHKIVIADPAVAALKIEGNFRATNVDAFVRLLESGFPVHAENEGDQMVLTSGDTVTRP